MRIRRAAKADRTDADGIVHDSRSEMIRWHELKLLERAGEIRDLRRQEAFPLAYEGRAVMLRSAGYPNGRHVKWTADFHYHEKGPGGLWRWVVEEHKGVFTEAARLRIAFFEAQYNTPVRVTGSADVVRRRRRVAA